MCTARSESERERGYVCVSESERECNEDKVDGGGKKRGKERDGDATERASSRAA